MLKREHRLKLGTKLIGTQALSSDLFILKFSKNYLRISRFGFSVTKKIDKRASERNLIRRRIRSCIENNLSKIRPGYDFLFIVKKQILAKDKIVICQSVVQALKKKGFLE